MAYREPWTDGAKAYPQADTLEDMIQGVRRKRKPLTVHVSHDDVGEIPCARCGRPLAGEYEVNPGAGDMTRDKLGYAYVDVDPRRKVFALFHYYCAWGKTMDLILQVGRYYS